MLCHIIIHAMSHHHTCYVTSSYMLCHIITSPSVSPSAGTFASVSGSSTCVCVCVCVCVCTYIHTPYHIYVLAPVCQDPVPACVCVCLRIHTYIHTYKICVGQCIRIQIPNRAVYVYIYMYTCIRVYMYTCMCIHVYAYMYIRMYIFVYVYVHEPYTCTEARTKNTQQRDVTSPSLKSPAPARPRARDS
jgi:hypothetical protein